MFKEVASVSELREKGRKLIEINDKKIVLFFLGGMVYALDAICPHRGFLLSDGEIVEGEVVCPGHGFTYSLENGNCSTFPNYKVHNYKVKLDGEKVFIEL